MTERLQKWRSFRFITWILIGLRLIFLNLNTVKFLYSTGWSLFRPGFSYWDYTLAWPPVPLGSALTSVLSSYLGSISLMNNLHRDCPLQPYFWKILGRTLLFKPETSSWLYLFIYFMIMTLKELTPSRKTGIQTSNFNFNLISAIVGSMFKVQ